MHVEGVPEHTDGPTEDDGRARRRGRRGGRRRRHDGKGEIPAHAEPGADQPDLPPVYAGPTPANPFGGNAFDIFDILEQAEAAPPPRTAEHPKHEAEAPVIADAPEPALTEMRRDHPTEELEEPTAAMAEPAIAEAADVEPRHEPPVLAAVAQTDAESTVAVPEPEPMIAANDAAPEPAIKPIIIGGEQDVMNQKKRGWWRR
jgi:ribonuclease E